MTSVRKIVNSHETLDNEVYYRLKEMIINNEFPSGELIIQNQLSEMFGVSRTPMRKAMGQLETEGLLFRSPKGWYIKQFTTEDMVSVFEIRAVLEGLASRLSVEKITLQNLDFMETMLEDAFVQYEKHGRTEPYYQADVQFHNMVVEMANDPLLLRTLSGYDFIATSLVQGLYRDPAETYPEHLTIIKAFREMNADLAESLMREHIRRAIPDIKSGEIRIKNKAGSAKTNVIG